MHVQITKTFTDFGGTVHTAGTKEHARNATAATWIDAKVAVEIKYANYQERLRAEDAERQRAQTPVYAAVEWAVCQGAISGKYYISGKCSVPQCTALTYDGVPTENLEFIHSCGCGVRGPEKVPQDICAQYRRLYRPAGKLGRDEAIAAVLGRPQPSLPVDMSRIVPANPTQEGCEREHLLLFLPNKGDGEHVEPSTYLWTPKGK